MSCEIVFNEKNNNQMMLCLASNLKEDIHKMHTHTMIKRYIYLYIDHIFLFILFFWLLLFVVAFYIETYDYTI